MNRRRITIHVDRVSVPPHLAKNAGAIQASMRAEVARALEATGSGFEPVPASVDSIDAGRAAQRNIGSRIGRQIGSILTGGERS